MIPISKPDLGLKEIGAVQDAFEEGWIALGPKVAEFEEKLEAHFNYPNVIATNSGTSALDLAVKSLSLTGTEILVPPITWTSTAHVVRYNDLDLGWVDVNESTLNMDPDSLRERISDETAAVIVVHYGGQAAEIDTIVDIAREHNTAVIEDAAHAIGTEYKGKPLGTFGDVGCFSFQESKPLTTGEGGALITNNSDIEALARRLSKVGVDKSNRYERTTDESGEYEWDYDVTHVGYKYFMHDVSAAIGLAQIDRFERLQQRRQMIADRYENELGSLSWVTPLETRQNSAHAWYNYTIRVPSADRDNLISHLHQNNVSATVHYKPLYKHTVFNHHSPDLPQTESVWKEMVTLPMSSALTDLQITQVIAAVKQYDPKQLDGD